MEAATTTLERRVREIPPTRKPEELLRNYDGKMRVAAYCRVSTDSEEQLNSYEAQKTYYTQIGRWRAFTQMRASPEPASKRERSSIR